MKNKIASFSRMFVLLALGLFGCVGPEGRVKTALYDSASRTATTRLDVFQLGEKPGKPHHVIALLTVHGGAHDEGECVQGMLLRARKLGADGLMILETEAPNKNIVFTYGMFGPSPDDRVFKSNAIVYDK